MLTQRDVDAAMDAARKVSPDIPPVVLHRICVAVILAVDIERNPVSIVKDVLGGIFSPTYRGG